MVIGLLRDINHTDKYKDNTRCFQTLLLKRKLENNELAYRDGTAKK